MNNSQKDQFQRELNLSSGAKKHLEDRFFDSEIIKTFQIGFCPPTSKYSFDLLNGRLIVPIHDAYGDVIAFSGRRLEVYGKEVKDHYIADSSRLDGLNKYMKWKTAKWINTSYYKADHLYNLNLSKKYIYEKNFCFVVEGYFDVMHLHKLGFKNVVALCGTTLSEKHCDLIFRYCDKIILMLDGDESGQIATEKSSIRARNKHLYTNIVKLPDKFDPDNLTKDHLDFISNEVLNSSDEVYIEI